MKLQLEKISEIINFKSPKDANELKSFLGVIGFLRKFINERAILTAPLYGLLKKNKRFMWDDLCEINFRNLKQKVAEVDTLLLPNFLKPFIVFCDASDKTKAFNLAQEENKQLRQVFLMVAGHYLILIGGITQMIKGCCQFVTQISVVIFINMEITLLLIQITSLYHISNI